MSTYDQTGADTGTVAAVFNDRQAAHAALASLRDAGFHHAWLGVTNTATDEGGEPTLENGGPEGFIASVGRFFSGEGFEGSTLHAALVHHGCSEQQARRIDATIVPGNAVVTVEGNDDPAGAMRIMRQSGGRLEGSFAAWSGDDAAGQSAAAAARRPETTERIAATGIDPNADSSHTLS